MSKAEKMLFNKLMQEYENARDILVRHLPPEIGNPKDGIRDYLRISLVIVNQLKEMFDE